MGRVPLFSRLLSFMPTSPHLSVSLSDGVCQLFIGAREHGHCHSPRAPGVTAPLHWPATGEWLPLLISGFCVFDGMTFGWWGGGHRNWDEPACQLSQALVMSKMAKIDLRQKHQLFLLLASALLLASGTLEAGA